MNPQENPPLDDAAFRARLDRAMQRHAATQPAYWPVTDDAAQPGTVTLPADLKTQIQDEVSIQQCRFDEQTHQGIDAAIRVFARLVESWRPVPAEAGDSTASESPVCPDKASGVE